MKGNCREARLYFKHLINVIINIIYNGAAHGNAVQIQWVQVRNSDARTGMKTFSDGGSVDVVTSTQTAGDEIVQGTHGGSTSPQRSLHLQSQYHSTAHLWQQSAHHECHRLLKLKGTSVRKHSSRKHTISLVTSNLGRGPRRGAVAHVRRKVPIGYNGAPQIRPQKYPFP